MSSRLRFALLLVGLLGAAFCAARDEAPNSPPKAAIKPVTDTYFGKTIEDPYRWLEDAKNPDTIAWMKAQAQYADAVLDSLPLRDELLKRINEVSDIGDRVSNVQRRGDNYFYYKRAPGENDNKLYVRSGIAGKERLLVDPERLSKADQHFSLAAYSPSNDGKLVSYILSPGGGEFGDLHVMDVATARDLTDRIPATRWDAGSWTADGRAFTYFAFQKLAAEAPATERYKKVLVKMHTLGTPVDNDRTVFGHGVHPDIDIGTTPIPSVYFPRGTDYAVASVNSGVSPNSEFYIAPLASFGTKPTPWTRVASLDDEVRDIAIHGDDLFLLTYKNTPRYRIVRTSAKNPDFAKAKVFFPAGDGVVENLGAARDALYVQTLDGGSRRLHRVEYATGKAEVLKLPFEGAGYIRSTDAGTDGLLFGVDAWTRSTALFEYNPESRTSTDLKVIPPIPVDLSGIDAVTVKVRSHDGAMVPLVILHKRGLPLDGRNPTLLNGYGAYGAENTSPYFLSSMLPWLERGGVFAFAGVRGGGEYGEEWHLAGKGATKSNTWKDFIACAEYLVRKKYTSPAHLAGQGGSAGGILIGNAIVERPDLFGAAVDNVGLNNALRAETTANGVPNIPEFGTHTTKEGFNELLAMDAYHKVKDGVKYPAVLLTHGINDPRVDPWMSAKMAARLQAATASGKPVLLRIEYDGGHGIGSTKKQRNEEQADTMAFLFEQLGRGEAPAAPTKSPD